VTIGYIQEKIRLGTNVWGEKCWSSDYCRVAGYCEKSNKIKASLRKN